MNQKRGVKILGQGSSYSFPVITGPHKSGIAKLETAPKLGARVLVESEKSPRTIKANFKSIKGASKVYKGLTGVNIEGLPNLTGGHSCRCGKHSDPVSVSNFREDPKGKDRLVCLKCGGRVKNHD